MGCLRVVLKPSRSLSIVRRRVRMRVSPTHRESDVAPEGAARMDRRSGFGSASRRPSTTSRARASAPSRGARRGVRGFSGADSSLHVSIQCVAYLACVFPSATVVRASLPWSAQGCMRLGHILMRIGAALSCIGGGVVFTTGAQLAWRTLLD